jgi:TPR repeat protein
MKARTFAILLPLAALTLGGCTDIGKAKDAYRAADYAQSRAEAEKLANLGFPEGKTLLGQMYMEGRGFPQNYKKGMELFRAAAVEDYQPALINIGEAYREGTGVPRSYVQSKTYFERAIALGSVEAYAHLGQLEQDQGRFAAAEKFYKMADARGYRSAWKYFGNLHIAQGKFALAEADFRRGIDAGDPGAWFDLGRVYKQQGKWKQAAENYTKAIASGNTDAYIQLGDAQVELGQFDEAEKTYKRALAAGQPKAAVKIGEMYKQGEGKPLDGAQALYWFYVAKNAGVPDMDRKIASTEKKLQPEELARALKLSAGIRK